MKIALAQFNPTVGDISGNVGRIADLIDSAAQAGADLVVFGELSVVGYPPRDLLRKDHFVADCVAAVKELAARCTKIAALVGFVQPNPDPNGRPLHNAAGLLADGKVRHVHVKSLLPTYDVFDETRYFQPGHAPEPLNLGGTRVGLSVCEDLWDAQALGRELYGLDPVGRLAEQGARVIVNMAASPFHVGKAALREDMFRRQAGRTGATIVYVNQVGGNDELVFDGTSCVVSPDGEVVARARAFGEDLLVVDLDNPAAARREPLDAPLARLSQALKLGLRDYVRKCGFRSVVLGLSGGIDSAVVATLAADALGPENVDVLLMPSRYSSEHSVTDAADLARSLGVRAHTAAIEPIHRASEAVLTETLGPSYGGLADENVQARIRGLLVMAQSNTCGNLPLATGNKSELSVGYCTLYGDMCGGLAPIGDVLKTDVYRLARQLNAESDSPRIPESTLTKPPSAELRPDQVDQDSLPPYDVLDGILRGYVEEDRNTRDLILDGYDADTVARVVKLVDRSEYKRKQAAPVLKVSPRAFGTGRRMPIAQRYLHTPPNGIH